MAASSNKEPGVSGAPEPACLPDWTALEKRFAGARDRLSPSRQKLVRQVLEQPESAYYLSSNEIARRYKVDPATIVRTVQALGYARFAEFSADLREHFVARITPYAALKAAAEDRSTPPDRARQNLDLAVRNLQTLRSTLNPDAIVALAKEVKRARRILVVGIDLAASLSWYLAYGLMTIGFAADAPIGSSGNIQRRVRTLTRQDLLIAISFGRCLRDTVEATQRARRSGVPTFGITDSETSPLAKACERSLITSVSSLSFSGSYVAPMALLGVILEECGRTKTAKSLELLRRSQEEDRVDHRWHESDSGLGRENEA